MFAILPWRIRTADMFVLLVTMVTVIEAIEKHQIPPHFRLKKHLLTNYEPLLRPLGNPYDVVQIRVNASLYQIIEVSNNKLQATIGLDFNWNDIHLAWNPKDFEDMQRLFLPYSSIWTPDVKLFYNTRQTTTDGETNAQHVQVDNFGNVHFVVDRSIEVLCPLNVKRFPFDTQSCNVTFGSFVMLNRSMHLEKDRDDVDLSSFYDHQEWELQNATLFQELIPHRVHSESYSCITINVQLKRQSFFYVFNGVFPAASLTFMALIGFHLPGSSQPIRESKIPLGMTTLLALCYLLIGLSESMPKFAVTEHAGPRGSFSGVPLIAIYYSSLFILITVSCITTTLFAYADRRIRFAASVPAIYKVLARMINPLALIPADIHFEGNHMAPLCRPESDGFDEHSRLLANVGMIDGLEDSSECVNHANPHCCKYRARVVPLLNNVVEVLHRIHVTSDNARKDIAYLRRVQSLNTEWAKLFVLLNQLSFCLFMTLFFVTFVALFLFEYWY